MKRCSYAIECSDLCKIYRHSSKPALSRITVSLSSSQIVAVLGRNGAGKTTFLRIASTQLLPTSGKMTVFGLDIWKQENLIRDKIAVVPQEGHPIPSNTAWEHVYYYLILRGLQRSEAKTKASDMLEILEMSKYRDVPTQKLSGGLRQRVYVAMALASEAELIFLDEPTVGLDPITRRVIWGVIRRFRNEGKTLVLTTHYIEEAENLADSILIIHNGEIAWFGDPETLKATYRDSRRITISSGFSANELRSFGNVSNIGSGLVLVCEKSAATEFTKLAATRLATFSVQPLSLEDIFVDKVGKDEKNTHQH